MLIVIVKMMDFPPNNVNLAQLVKNPPVIQGTLVRFLGQEEPLEKGLSSLISLLSKGLSRVFSSTTV